MVIGDVQTMQVDGTTVSIAPSISEMLSLIILQIQQMADGIKLNLGVNIS